MDMTEYDRQIRTVWEYTGAVNSREAAECLSDCVWLHVTSTGVEVNEQQCRDYTRPVYDKYLII